MHEHDEAKIRRHSIGDVRPAISMVVRAIKTPVILQEQALRAGGMHGDLVYTLSKFGILVGHEHSADSAVLCIPSASTIISAINAARRDCHVYALVIGGVEHDRVQGQTSVARHPPGPVWMVEQSAHQCPGLARVPALEQRCWFYAAIEYVWLLGVTERNLPDIFQRNTCIRGESNRGLLWIGPTLSEIITRSEKGAPITLSGSPYSVLATAVVVSHRVNAMAVEIRTSNFPTGAPRIRAENECSFCGSYQ